MRKLDTEGVNPTHIAKKVGIGRASVYRILGAEPEHVIKMTNRLKKWPKGKVV